MTEIHSKFSILKQKLSNILAEKEGHEDLLQELDDLEEYIKQTNDTYISEKTLYNKIINHSPDILYRFSSVRGGLFWSNRVIEILGITPSQLNQDSFPWFNSIHPEDKERVKEAIENYQNGAEYNIEYRFIRPDGEEIWLHDVFIDKTIVNDEVIIEGHASDITKRKHAELQSIKQKEELRIENERFVTLMDSIPAAIYVADLHTYELLFVNKYLIERFGDINGKICYNALQENQNAPCHFCSNHLLLDKDRHLNEPYVWEFLNTKTHRWYQVRDAKIRWIDGRDVRLEIATDITERKNIEQLLKNSEEHLNSLVNYRAEAVWSIDRNFNYIYFNEFFRTEYQKIFNAEPHIGKTVELNNERSFNFWKPKFDAVFKGERLVFDFKSFHDGEEHYYQTFLNPITIDNQISAISGFAAEITERVKTENVIRENEEKLSLIFDLIEVGITITDKEGTIKEYNKAAENILGSKSIRSKLNNYTSENWNFIKQDGTTLAPNDWPVYKALYHDQQVRNEIIGIKINKDIKWISVNASPLHLTDKGALVTYFDITASIQANKSIIENEEKYHYLFDNVGDAIFLLDLHANFLGVNNTATEIYGYSNEDFLKMNIRDIDTIDESKKVEERLEILKTGKILTFETRHRLKDGSEIDVDVNSHLSHLNGKPVLLSIIHNITERKKNELKLQEYAQELKQLNADKDRFMQILAHDLRSPFNALIGLSDILIQNFQQYDASRLEGYLMMINQTHHKTFDLLEDLLLWTKSQTGKIPFNPTQLNLWELCNEVLLEKRNQADIKLIQLYNQIPSNVEVTSDKNMLKTIIRNLVSNAIKFTPSKGSITVDCECLTNEIHIHVIDTGVGISAENLEQLWSIDRIFTTTGTNNEYGTGLGLTLCKELVGKHQGKIWAQSKVGFGSKFSFSLPKK